MKVRNKLIAILLCAALLLGALPMGVSAAEGSAKCDGGADCPAKGFVDVPDPDNWAHEGIDYCVANELMNGISDTVFNPDGTVSRAQLVTILYRAAGSPEAEAGKGISFSDVADGMWYSDAIAWASAKGVVNGVSEDRFAPMDPVNREQIATILYRYADSPEVSGSLIRFPDNGNAHPYAYDALVWATRSGLINGIKSGGRTMLAPQNSATRAQIASIIMRFLVGAEPVLPTLDGIIGISMPTRDLIRWEQDGFNMKSELESCGYEVDLQFAANDPSMQISHLENMIANGAEILIIAPIDSEALGNVLRQAKEAGVIVISYDRLIMGSDAVTCYTTFDNYLVGMMQGQYIVDTLDLTNAGSRKYNIEFITGDPGDSNINFFYDGALSVLQQYLDSGVLQCISTQVDKTEVATEGWDSAKAQERFENILSTYYCDKPLHAVLASNDSTAQGVSTALACTYSNDVYPIITGQDCDIVSVMNMMDGRQAMSVFKDTRDLAAKTVELCQAFVEGIDPPINDNETFDNGTGIIPSYLCVPKICTRENIQELLIDSGYYTWEDLAH